MNEIFGKGLSRNISDHNLHTTIDAQQETDRGSRTEGETGNTVLLLLVQNKTSVSVCMCVSVCIVSVCMRVHLFLSFHAQFISF